MQKVVVIYKASSAEALELARRLAGWLGQRGRAVLLHEAQAAAEPAEAAEPGLDLPPDCGLVVVLGGDGTMLGAVREVVRAGLEQAPILGVNLGGLGFLTALAPEELTPALTMVLEGQYAAPPRLMLEAAVHRDGRVLRRVVALNDVVINKAALARIVELKLCVDEKPLTVFRADGLIISTPTGSTAYNLSAGGPICHPSLDCIVVTPICSFALSNRPLLLGPQMTLSVELGRRAQDTTLTSDGQVGVELLPGDRITIRRAGPSVRLVQSPFKDYFEILRTKLRWG
ncbi:MAG: NAD(+)/NADH kinase [Thermodesulfobacteriota bacterium]